jgi:hypothetical protein
VNASQGSAGSTQDGQESYDIPTGVFIESKADTAAAGEGQEVTFALKATCGCEAKSDLVFDDILSNDLIYVAGSGGTLHGDTVRFTAGTLNALDSLIFSYRARIAPCSATEPEVISEDDADGTDQFESFKLAGTGTRQWIKSAAQSESAPNSWYARDYTSFCDYVLRLIDPLEVDGPVEVAFDHRYETEATYDGGVVEYSLDGTTWIDAGPYFIENGYPGAITNTNSNISGRDAFTGDSDDQFNTTGFIHSAIRLNIGGMQSLRLRFRFACDGAVGGPGINGWYVDNIVISQLSGITNQTRVTAEDVLVDSVFYGVQTTPFSGNMYIDQSASGNRSGTSWEHAMPDFLFALEVLSCRSSDSIFVAEGSYLPNDNDDRAVSFQFPDSTWIFGGFPLGGSSFASRDPSTYLTIFSGDIGVEGQNTDNVYHVVSIDSAQQDILLDGLTIRDGNADGGGDAGQGAGIFCRGGLTLQNVILSNHKGVADGKIIRIRDDVAHLILRDCTIYGPDDAVVKLLNSGSGQVTVDGSTVFLVE